MLSSFDLLLEIERYLVGSGLVKGDNTIEDLLEALLKEDD